MKLNDHDFMRGYSDSELHEDANQLAWEAMQEKELLEEQVTVDEYQRYTQQW